jgi:hypothetical protein
MAHATDRCGLNLDSLTVAGTSHTIFDRCTDRGRSMSHALRALVRPLRRLRLFIQAWPPRTLDTSEDSSNSGSESDKEEIAQAVCHQSVSVLEEGHAWKFLAEALELRLLKLERIGM